MTTFADAVNNQSAQTENGMPALNSSGNAAVDFFYSVGALRNNKNEAVRKFVAAFAEDEDIAVRIALWSRDIRFGAGERAIFRAILTWLELNRPDVLLNNDCRVLRLVPEFGRWDDLLGLHCPKTRSAAFDIIATACRSGNALAAKWMPRKGPNAIGLRRHMHLSPKQYRKMLVNLSDVVETKMCQNKWDDIDFNVVPSMAMTRYQKAFSRHTVNYGRWVESLNKPGSENKVNAGAVYPHDVLRPVLSRSVYLNADGSGVSPETRALIMAMWDALPNYVAPGAVILPMIDVSGSMVDNDVLHVAVSLGLYLADKNTGKFKDIFLTFSENPMLQQLHGDILMKVSQMSTANWGMSTDITAACLKILKTSVDNNVPQSEMPKVLLILSDMQFDQCTINAKNTALEMIRTEFETANYSAPRIVFWNLRHADNVPVRFNEDGVALVSGFSPSILQAVFRCNDEEAFNPTSIMRETVMSQRYEW